MPKSTGKQKPGALSNNFSLAEMLEPIWAGCVASSDRRLEGLADSSRQMPNFAWSSQGRGFFTDRAGRDKRDNEELVRVWYSEKNFGRRDRAIELAARLRQEPDPCRARLCAGQPFPSVPLIGPRTLDELDDSLRALDIKLSPADLAWLDGGSLHAA